MKEAQAFLNSFTEGRVFTYQEVVTLILQAQVDANDYKDRVIHALFRMRNGEPLENPSAVVATKGLPFAASPVAARKSDSAPRILPREASDVAATVAAVGEPEPEAPVSKPTPKKEAPIESLLTDNGLVTVKTKAVPSADEKPAEAPAKPTEKGAGRASGKSPARKESPKPPANLGATPPKKGSAVPSRPTRR